MNYVRHILLIKKWEYEAIADKLDAEILKDGPDDNNTSVYNCYNTAKSRAKEIDRAIEIIEKATT